MTRRLLRLAAAAAVAFYPATAGATIAPPKHKIPSDRPIQLGLVVHAKAVSLTPEGRVTVVDARGKRHSLAAGKRLRVEPASGAELALGPLRVANGARLIPRDKAVVEIAGKRYGGQLILRLDPGGKTVTVVEETGIEEYLLGVLPFEMDPGWPLQALKAQAVVARTFAYTQLGKYSKEGFDLTTDTRSQVYGGLGSVSDNVLRAVKETRGEVLGYKGQILPVYYHACCGGHTESAARVWGGDAPPPLRGVRDRYCSKSPLASWTAYFSYPDLLAALLKSRLTGGKLKRFEIGRKDGAGYALTLVAKIGARTIYMKATELRAALGGGLLRSVRIRRIKKLKKGVEFFGSGAGHGVGLCQWGARLQAEKGRGYEKILSFYFPGSVLSVIDE